ncbi:MAG: succinate dehydrogenase/fumarate reductase iron-sulfur subunit [Gammaproteobacteria bacterium]|nr:succinate dehydrogenase/fumarate reductase iron-sulfur subunit [Gammaproteobacteria bacterium]
MNQIKFKIRRYSSATDTAPYWQTFSVETEPGMTVLQGLQQIRERLDATLAWRHSCRMGVCGSCAMIINSEPQLACNTQIQNLSAQMITLEALWNFPVAKDLVPDLMPMFEKHRDIAPYLIRDGGDLPKPGESELRQSPEELNEFLQFSSCIKCGACMAACPTLANDPHFLGPMPLTATHRYNSDSRDTGFSKRKEKMDGHHSIAHCHYAAECTRVCPKGVDPARAIQLMKRDLVLDLFHFSRRSPAQPCDTCATVDHDSLKAPVFTAREKN